MIAKVFKNLKLSNLLHNKCVHTICVKLSLCTSTHNIHINCVELVCFHRKNTGSTLSLYSDLISKDVYNYFY